MTEPGFWHYVRRLIGFQVVRLGWRIYPRCKARAVLTRHLAEWAEFVLADHEGAPRD